jgi:cobaltochelatase CobT
VTIMDVEQLGGTIMEQLAELFEDEMGAGRR